MSRLALSPLLLLTACGGSVVLEDVDPFGGVTSALWVHWDDRGYDTTFLTNVPGACQKLQAVEQATEDFNDAAAELDWEDLDNYCEDLEEPFLALASAASALYYPGAHFVELAVSEDGDTEPDEETYEVGDEEAALSGNVLYWEDDVYAQWLEDYDNSGGYEDNCDIDLGDRDSAFDYWYLADGELEIGALTDEKGFSGKLEGELEDDDSDDAGEIVANFSATWCEIDI